MSNKKLQIEILKFIAGKEDSVKQNLSILSIEFIDKGYTQKTIDKNLYLLAKSGRIGAKIIDDETHQVYAPLFLLENGQKETDLWIKKNLLKVFTMVGIIASTIAAIFSMLSFFK